MWLQNSTLVVYKHDCAAGRETSAISHSQPRGRDSRVSHRDEACKKHLPHPFPMKVLPLMCAEVLIFPWSG